MWEKDGSSNLVICEQIRNRKPTDVCFVLCLRLFLRVGTLWALRSECVPSHSFRSRNLQVISYCPNSHLSYTRDILRVYNWEVISSAQLSARENFFQKKHYKREVIDFQHVSLALSVFL